MAENNPEKLIKKAEKLLSPGFFKALLTTTDERLDQAIDYYNDAAEIYKIDKNYEKAINCYKEIVFLKQQQKENPIPIYDTIIVLNDKRKMSQENLEIFKEIITYYKLNNQYAHCGEYELKKIPILLKQDKKDDILKIYNTALSYFQMDKNTKSTLINEAKIQKADFIILNNIKDLVAESKAIYEEVGKEYLVHPSGKIFAQDYFFKCVLCYLVYDDYLMARAFFHKFCDIDSNFKNSNLGNFCIGLINSLESVTDNFRNDEIVNFEEVEDLFLKSINYNGKIYTDWHKEIVSRIKLKYNMALKEANMQYVADEDFK